MSFLKSCVRDLFSKYYSGKHCAPLDKSFFKNKRVAIIGGADSVLEEKNGAYIDDFDVIVRVNKGVEIISTQKEYIGTRTDFLFHSFYDIGDPVWGSPITIDLWKKNNVKNIVYAYHSSEKKFQWQFIKFHRLNNENRKLLEMSDEHYRNTLKILDSSIPTVGFIAINTIFECEPKELFITGFTFFKTEMNNEYRKYSKEDFAKLVTLKDTHHNFELEYSHIKSLFRKSDGVITVDKILKNLFDRV